MDMFRYLKTIGFLMFAFVVLQTICNTFIVHTVDDSRLMGESNTITYHPCEESSIKAPQLPYLPEAELAGNTLQLQLSTFLRIQRSFGTEYASSIKNWMDMIAQREAILSLQREKLYDTTAYYRCHPVCEYYIFTLRRILI